VWPRDRTAPAECLRIGRHSAERWAAVDGGLSLQAQQRLPQDRALQPSVLVEAMAALYPSPPGCPVALILESAWLPVMLVNMGERFLRAAQLDALVRHRFALRDPDSSDPVAGWELRADHRAGSQHALAYGLALQLKQALLDSARTVNLELTAITPALSWGMERLLPAKGWRRTAAWWLWPEQDRTLVVRILSNEVAGLNAGAPPVTDESELLQLTDIESARLGLGPMMDPIAAAIWSAAPRAAQAGERFSWIEVSRRRGSFEPKTADALRAPA